MRLRGVYLGFVWSWMMLAHAVAYAQIQGRPGAMAGVDASGNAQTVEAALHQMSDRAAVIFVGIVTDVRRTNGAGAGPGTVEIQFDIEQPIRGCAPGTYTLREWGGLWTANDTRYHLGQHLLMLLHAPGATGLSSPVGGTDGAIALRASGRGVRPGDSSSTPSEAVADLRWLAAKISRTVTYRSARVATSSTSSQVRQSPARTLATPFLQTGSDAPAQDAAIPAQDASTPAQEAAVTSVVAMLRSWEVPNDTTR